jgi:hypothetical protein
VAKKHDSFVVGATTKVKASKGSDAVKRDKKDLFYQDKREHRG